jgi:hypothetical protein
MTALDHLRFRFAFSHRRRQAIKTGALLAAILLAYAVVGTLDYADAQRAEAMAQAEQAQRWSATLADCLNGTARFVHDGPHTDGYGKTGIVCLRAEEYRL